MIEVALACKQWYPYFFLSLCLNNSYDKNAWKPPKSMKHPKRMGHGKEQD